MKITRMFLRLLEKYFPHKIKGNAYLNKGTINESHLLPIMSKEETIVHLNDKVLEDMYEGLVRPNATIDEIKSVFNDYINVESFAKKQETLKRIHEDSVYIGKLLEPLIKIGLNLTVDIVGGSVRDFVLGKEIKDLDIMVSFWDVQNTVLISEDILIKAGFSQEHIKKVDWKYLKEDVQSIKCKLIELCCLRADNQPTIMISNMKDLSEYDQIVNRLEGVVKLENKEKKLTNYNIDFLITDLIKPEFIECFDYNICKASFCLRNSYYQKDFPQEPMVLLSRFVGHISFFIDIASKSISQNLYKKTKENIESSINDHLPRIEKKYPDYKYRVCNEVKNESLYNHAFSYYEKHKVEKLLIKENEILNKASIKNFKI